MNSERNHVRRVYSVPEALREQFISSDEFERRMSQVTGWRVFSCRLIYTDPLVIRQSWLNTAHGNGYSDRAFYHLFAEQSFRAVLRLLLAHTILSREQFLSAIIPPEKQADYLVFLHDQDMLLQTKAGYIKGPQLLHISDLGHTLEAWVAEWLRRFQAFQGIRLSHPPGCVPVRHGVSFTELVGEGDPGDLDVVAVFPQGLVLVECKSSLLQVDLAAWRRFAWRVAFLEPAYALFLVDTSDSSTSKGFRAAKRQLRKWQFTEASQHERVCVFQRPGSLQATGPREQALVWEAGVLHAALVGREHSLTETLETVFQTFLSEAAGSSEKET